MRILPDKAEVCPSTASTIYSWMSSLLVFFTPAGLVVLLACRTQFLNLQQSYNRLTCKSASIANMYSARSHLCTLDPRKQKSVATFMFQCCIESYISQHRHDPSHWTRKVDSNTVTSTKVDYPPLTLATSHSKTVIHFFWGAGALGFGCPADSALSPLGWRTMHYECSVKNEQS